MFSFQLAVRLAVVLLVAISTGLLTSTATAIPYVPGSGPVEIQFSPIPNNELSLYNLEGAFTFTTTAEQEAVLRLFDVDPIGGVERFEAFDHGLYTGLWTENGCCLALNPGFHSLTFRIQQWKITEPDIEPNIWLATFEVTAVPEPSTALLLACGLAGLAAAGRRRSLH
ncbi:unnamed protein product [marine sediment metagenome]|uniref:Ice-binding protein C-terminal domain-containing protein n=1 Tax=marine sediment metagenome TaxID=412755 RepID=X0XNG1_9ZZZZ